MDNIDESTVDREIADRFSTFRPDGDWQPDLQHGIAILRERQGRSHKRKRRLVLLAAGAAVASLPITALPVTRAFAARCVSACVAETSVVREALLGGSSSAASGSTYVRSADRKSASDFVLTDGAGRPVRLSDYRGRVVLLNFWATWCGPCGQEIPWFVEFQQLNKSRGLSVLGVSMDEGGWATVKPYVAEKQINYPVVLGNDHVAGLFGGLHTIPLTLIIDRAGRIAAIHAGLCRKDEYENDINAVLNER